MVITIIVISGSIFQFVEREAKQEYLSSVFLTYLKIYIGFN